ncbi:TonB-dependent receptor family protein [Flavobacterium sp.]|uniref:TonB-dependent receptor family protein n=1 Tax=Flavobacterium sp. TaxID=239 RepID=UPI00286E4816|nr:TonB-dependent receptor family protein [Flavobacterium sp.]
MKKSIVLIILMFPIFGLAQFKLKGKITNQFTYTNIEVKTQNKTIISKSTVNGDGTFEIDLKEGIYELNISAIGFSDWKKEISISSDLYLGTITLTESATKLNEVVIEKKKKIMEQKIDKLVYNVGENIVIAGGDALNALSTAPGVVVQNNSINLLGKGIPRVMIDDRMVELSGEELNNYLKSFSASDIKNIEILSNPSAKYDASGNGGIININFKKGTRNSWKNTSTLSYDQNKYQFYTLRNSFFYNKNKFRFSASGNGVLGNFRNTEAFEVNYPNGLWQLEVDSKIKKDNLSGRFTLDYDFSDKTSIGIQYLKENNNPGIDYNSDINIFNNSNAIQTVTKTNGFQDRNTGSNTINAHLISKLDSLQRKLSIDIDYFTYNSRFDNDFIAKTFLPDLTFLNIDQSARNISNQNIENISIKSDMEHPLKFLNLSYGVKASFIKSRSNISYFNTISGNPIIDLNQSNQFKYQENNQAIYINSDKKINEKLTIQLGLRIENTQTEGFSKTLNQKTTNNYLQFFPTFYISYTKNDNHNFNFNYGKRINRPNFDFLNPFRTYINNTTYSEGNPFLQPSFSNNFNFTYSYKEKLRTNVFFNVRNNGYGVIFTSNPINNTQVVTRENYFKEYSFGIVESYSTKITNWWESRSEVNFLGSKTEFIKNINAKLSNSLQVYLSTNNTFSLGESTKLQVDYFYSSPFKSGLFEVGYMSGINIAINQNILKKKLQITLLANDIFNTSYLKDYKSVVNGINQIYTQNDSARFFRISMTYNFGNKKIEVQERDFGNEDEKNRTSR